MSSAWDVPISRQSKILELLQESGHVRVHELSETFGVAEITIRRDLDTLESRGILERVHGGAVSLSRLRHEKAFTQKYQHNLEIKKRLAQVLINYVESGDLICINSGSTMLIAMEMLIHEDITIFTNNGGILQSLPEYQANLNILGGHIRPESLAIVGPGVISQIDNIYPTKTLLGVDGFNMQSGLTSPNEFEADVGRKMISQTRGDVILVADHSKIGVISNFAISGIEKVSMLICDDALDSSYRESIQESGITLVIAPPYSSG